jgi:hypothetical protein
VHEIYFKASINISATAARSGRGGIFNSADKDRCHTKPLVRLPSYDNGSKKSEDLSQSGHRQEDIQWCGSQINHFISELGYY